MGKSNPLRHIVQRLKLKAKAVSSMSSSSRSDVPPGHLPVCVGIRRRRFIMRITHLNHPVFQKILDEGAKKYGFDCMDGPLFIPCDESEFEEALRVVTRSGSAQFPSRCRVVTESMPLIHGVHETMLLC